MKRIPFPARMAIISIAVAWFFWGPADAYFALYLKTFTSDYGRIGLYVSLWKMIPILAAIPLGILADKYSARKIAAWSILLMIIIPVMYYFAGLKASVTILIIGLLLNGLIKTMKDIGINTYIKDMTPRNLSGKVWARHEGICNGYWGVGLIAGAFLVLHLELHQLFLIVIPGLMTHALVFFLLPDEKKTKRKKLNHLAALKHMDKRVFAMLVVAFLFGATIDNMDVFLALFAESLNIGIMAIGLLMGFIYTAVFLAKPMNHITKHIGRFHSMALGTTIMSIALFAVIIFPKAAALLIFIAFFIHTLAYRLVLPVRNGIITRYTPQHMQGEISGALMMTSFLGASVGASIFGYIAKLFGLPAVFIASLAVYALLIVGFMVGIGKFEHRVKQSIPQEHGAKELKT